MRTLRPLRFYLALVAACACVLAVSPAYAEAPLYEESIIFPYQHLHVHGSSVVELPNGDILTCWFQGTGERWADDVVVMGARKRAGAEEWGAPFVMAETRGFPDINPTLFIDADSRLWLVWYAVLANQWETSLLQYTISTDYEEPEEPVWDWQYNLLMKPGDSTERGIQPDDSFVRSVEEQARAYAAWHPEVPGAPMAMREAWIERVVGRARGDDMIRAGRSYLDAGAGDAGGYESAELGYPLSRRIGWQTQNKPVVLEGGRIVLPLYSDGFSFSIMAITDDGGENWHTSTPLVGFGSIQPAIAEKADGTLVAFMRDNGPPPKRIHLSESTDRGETWGPVHYSELPNPGTGCDILTTPDGKWVLAYNDLESGRTSLAVAISEDEGQTWPWIRRVEHDTREDGEATRSHYPAIVQGADGTFHLTYSYHHNDRPREASRSIKYVRFNEAWVKAGE